MSVAPSQRPMRTLRSRLVAGCLLACLASSPALAGPNIVDDVLSFCAARPHSYEQMVAALAQLDRSDRVTVVPIGNTPGGRQIHLVAVAWPGTQFGQTARLFIIARQHGNEEAGTEAMMALIRYLSQANGPNDVALLQRLTFAIIPMANPDGAAGDRRRNRGDVDLNRDWASLTQPETRLIDWAFRLWRPHAFIDCHELPASDPKPAYAESFVETIAQDPVLDPNMTALCTTLSRNVHYYASAYGHRLNVYYDSHERDRNLAHRHFGLDYGAASFLFESKTGASHSLRERVQFHVIGTLVVANLLAQRVSAPALATPSGPSAPVYRPIRIPDLVTPAPATRTPTNRQPQLPAKTTIRFTSPAADSQTFTDKVALRVDIEKSGDFAYLSVRVDGIMRTLTDIAPYQGSLAVEDLASGPHTVLVEAHDGSGRVIATAQRTVIAENVAAGP